MSETAQLEPPPRLAIKTLAVQLLDGDNAGQRVEASSEVLTVGKARDNDLVLSDKAVSRYHLELNVTERGVEVADLGSTNGTFLGSARIERAIVPLGSVLKVGRTSLELCDGEGATVPLSSGTATELVVGATPVMQRLMAQIEKVSDSEVPCLLMGESGTGKEVIARAIQSLSKRSRGPFVTVDCGAFAPNLVASELFGHEKGAFTGADRQHIGAFERAHGGVLFLDEIGELPLDLQPQLLGALERRQFRRLGGQKEINVDVQLVSATNRDLRVEVNEGTFRLDLYYRLAVVVLRLPPLRERRDDIPLLVEHF
ncbi:MAG TPA: sigma 54-dependent Fis family transcriptional regulator, partial [Polyangiaceae bacterium]|nr:sigma 54-dependent Fis family transcriptional regulator [Polyangiaceae bacterium]